MFQRLRHTQISVMKLDVFSHQGDFHLADRISEGVHHLLPVFQIRTGASDIQALAHHLGQTFLFHGQRRFIEIFHIQILQHMALRHVAEQGNFVPHPLVDGIFAAAYQHIRPQPHGLKFLHTLLGGLCLQFPGSLQIRNQGHMNQNGVFMTHLVLELPDGLQKWLALNVSYRTAHLDYGDPLFPIGAGLIKPALDFIGDMRNYLDGSSAVISPPLLLQHGPVNLSGGHIGILIQALIDESLIMSQIQIRLRSIVGDEYLAVLDRIHGSRIHIDIGIEFLHGYLVASGFQKPSQGRRRNSFSQARHHASSHKYILYCHHIFLLLCPLLYLPAKKDKRRQKLPVRKFLTPLSVFSILLFTKFYATANF